LRDENAGNIERLSYGRSDAPYGLCHGGRIFGVEIEDVLRRVFRNDERVPLRLRHDVHEGKRHVVFKDLEARRLATKNFRKDIVVIVGHGQKSSS
jgi:hypothetical protein